MEGERNNSGLALAFTPPPEPGPEPRGRLPPAKGKINFVGSLHPHAVTPTPHCNPYTLPHNHLPPRHRTRPYTPSPTHSPPTLTLSASDQTPP
jgi:hypothetical protein